MLDVILDTLIDGLKLLPFLFVAFLIIEFIEHKVSKKNFDLISKSDRFGPLIGGVLGIFPQCGFSVMATNLYVTRIITLGTLISVYLSTSDEMLPILISSKAPMSIIVKILIIKVIIGIIFGFIIDLFISKKKKEEASSINHEICNHDHCDCEHENIILSSLKHTLHTILFIIIISFVLNILFEYFDEDMVSKIFMKDNIFAPFLSCIIGLIPNCGASVMITELYLKEILSLGTTIGALLTGSGVAILILFRSNKNIKENFFILLTIYFIGVISGIVINIIELIM